MFEKGQMRLAEFVGFGWSNLLIKPFFVLENKVVNSDILVELGYSSFLPLE